MKNLISLCLNASKSWLKFFRLLLKVIYVGALPILIAWSVGFKVWYYSVISRYRMKNDYSGKTVVITGATDGEL